MWTLSILVRENGLTLKHWNRMILVVFKCRNSPREYYDTVKKFIEKIIGAVHYDQVVDDCKKNNSTILHIGQLIWRRTSSMPRIGRLKNGFQFLQKVEDKRKGFQYCLNPNYPHQFLYLRAIEGHSRSTINLALQDNVLLPEGFTEFFHHVGNGKELRSIVNHGLIPGGVSLRTGRHAVFFTIVNPMDNQVGLEGRTLYATRYKQKSRHTKILGNAFRIQYFGAIRSSLNKEDRNFIKQSQTQLSSMTHCLQSSLR